VLDDAAGLIWVANLGCIDLNPHPVRADDLDHPDELRVDLDPVPGIEWPQIRDVALVAQEALEAVGLVGWPKTSGLARIHINVRIERRWTYSQVRRAALALARDVENRAPSIATSKWWKEERHGVFLDYNQNAKDRTVASAYSVRPLPDARVSFPLRWPEVPDVRPEEFTIATVPGLYASRGDASDGIDDAVGSLDALLELSARHEAEGQGDAPWPPNYAKQEGEPPRVQPSRARRPKTEYEEGRGVEGGPPPDVAAERPRPSPPAIATPACRPSGKAPARRRPAAARRHPGHRDQPARDEGRGARGPRALEGPPSRGAPPPRAGRRPRRRHARPLLALVPGPGQPDPRPEADRPRQEPLDPDYSPGYVALLAGSVTDDRRRILRNSRSDDPTKEVSEDVQRQAEQAMAARDGVTIAHVVQRIGTAPRRGERQSRGPTTRRCSARSRAASRCRLRPTQVDRLTAPSSGRQNSSTPQAVQCLDSSPA
jgi:hypothetical protein